MRPTIALLAIALTGCTTGFVARVVEYDAEAPFLTSAQLGGCVVNVVESDASAAGKSSVKVTLRYVGEKCTAEVTSIGSPAAKPSP